VEGIRKPFDLAPANKTNDNRGNHTSDPVGVSPTFGAIGSYGATGLTLP